MPELFVQSFFKHSPALHNRIAALIIKQTGQQKYQAAIMHFAIQINSSPYHNNSGLAAYQFAVAALAQGHQIYRVFFYHDGIYHALRHNTPPDDETHLTANWQALAAQYQIDLVVCISAAQRRGLLCSDEAQRQGKQDNDLADGFRISGLGQLLEATLEADRFIIFG
ncbi:sulfurtransferase complex subunit TusD [Methylosoma difficile]